MNPEEYNNLARVEERHWFYAGKREIVRHWIQRFHPLKPADRLADCGAGTGIFVRKFRAFKQRLGFKTTARSEDQVPPDWLNRFLQWQFVRLACQPAVRFPAGVGLLAVLRKKTAMEPSPAGRD